MALPAAQPTHAHLMAESYRDHFSFFSEEKALTRHMSQKSRCQKASDSYAACLPGYKGSQECNWAIQCQYTCVLKTGTWTDEQKTICSNKDDDSTAAYKFEGHTNGCSQASWSSDKENWTCTECSNGNDPIVRPGYNDQCPKCSDQCEQSECETGVGLTTCTWDKDNKDFPCTSNIEDPPSLAMETCADLNPSG